MARKKEVIPEQPAGNNLPDRLPLDEGIWIQKVKVKDLKPNAWNPNQMSKEIFTLLKSRIKEAGFKHPILCQPDLTITDGEHRWNALMELGTEETYVIVADEDEVSAMLETANSNLIKGEFNPVKYGEFLNTLLKKMPLEQLAATLPTPQVQIEALTQLVSDLPKLKPEDMIPVAGQQKWVIKLEFGDETEYQEAEDGINQIAKILGTTSNSATLLHLIRGYAG